MSLQRITVVGAGNMGSGIAQAFASAGCTVTLNDVDRAAIERGLARIHHPLQKRVEAGKMARADLDALLGRIRIEPDLAAAVADADLVVEAVFEDRNVKQDLFRRLDAIAPTKTILATNTSSFFVRELAGVTARADRVVGLHFFFPAAVNQLVEVVKGPATSQATFDAAFEAVRRAGKVPIETADAPGFAVNRFFVPWMNEACRLVEEGVADIATIEEAAKRAFGITMGPFQLMNVTGPAIGLHAQETLHERLGTFYRPSPLLAAQVKSGKPWDLAGTPDPSRLEAAAARLRAVALGIACHLVDEGVCSVKDTDRGATIGLRWAKGPFAMMNDLGLLQVEAEVRALHGAWGEAFPVPRELARLAKAGQQWHVPTVAHELLDGGRVARITFDRPEVLNALGPHVLRDLAGALDVVERAGTVRALILTGAGRAFVAGADIAAMAAMDVAAARDYTAQGNRVIDRIAALPFPVIMALNGAALGGGLELALAGDLLIAASGAKLGLPEVNLGLHPGYGGTQRLPRRVGLGIAKDLVLTGRTVDADEAARIGLVNAVVPADQLQDHCLTVARGIADKAPLAVAGAKASLDRALVGDLRSGLLAEQESVILLFATKDKDEGLRAFQERRKPAFQGR